MVRNDWGAEVMLVSGQCYSMIGSKENRGAASALEDGPTRVTLPGCMRSIAHISYPSGFWQAFLVLATKAIMHGDGPLGLTLLSRNIRGIARVSRRSAEIGLADPVGPSRDGAS